MNLPKLVCKYYSNKSLFLFNVFLCNSCCIESFVEFISTYLVMPRVPNSEKFQFAVAIKC